MRRENNATQSNIINFQNHILSLGNQKLHFNCMVVFNSNRHVKLRVKTWFSMFKNLFFKKSKWKRVLFYL